MYGRFTTKEPSLEEFTANGGEYGKYRQAHDQWDASKEKLLQVGGRVGVGGSVSRLVVSG